MGVFAALNVLSINFLRSATAPPREMVGRAHPTEKNETMMQVQVATDEQARMAELRSLRS